MSQYIFQNKVLTFQSNINDFTKDIYHEYDTKFKEKNIQSRIDELFSGGKVNTTENRAALHPKYRDEYNHSNKNIKYLEMFKSAKNIVSVGIGGSFEGPKLLIETIGKTSANFIFITGSDEEEFNEKIYKLIPEETIFIVVSKSFTTDETILILNKALIWSSDISKFLAITSNRKEAKKYNIKNIIEFDESIGGRYSIWSDVSLIADWENKEGLKSQLIKGGKQADLDLYQDDEYFKFIKRLAYSDIWLNNFRKKNSRAILSYIWKFRSFPNYVQQLEMESLGKRSNEKSEFKKTGQIIFGGYGPTAQHSYFQLLHQGTQSICADIIACDENVNSLARAQAIVQSGLLSNGDDQPKKESEKINGDVPTNLFLLKNSDAFSLGYLIASWEHRTYITASMLEINPFDQFGVNAGKIYTRQYLANKD